MLDLFASARIYVGISLSDGISTSLLEAMAMGAFPIQTSTACVDDWFVSPQQGVSVDVMTSVAVAQGLSRALEMDHYLAFQASHENRVKISKSASSGRSQATSMYSSSRS
jgi:glycosyltransferase involved in cell wall biosynthesis